MNKSTLHWVKSKLLKKHSDLCGFTQSGNLGLIYRGWEVKITPNCILFCKFLVTHPDFTKFGGFSKNLSGTNILEILLKI